MSTQSNAGNGQPQSQPAQPVAYPPSLVDKIPSVKLFIPPKGPFSPQISERCFTYSSQTARGRTLGEEPWSRTVCIRRVFNHEVRRQLDPRWRHPLDPFKAVVPLDIPLPPESRTPISGFLAGPAAPSSPSPNSSTSPPPSRAPFSPSTSISTSARDTSGAEPPHQKYWEPGYYLWLSRSRHATQEHMDLMSRSLTQQAVYERQKQEANETWARAAKRGQAVWYWADSPEGTEGRTDGQAQGATGADAQVQVQGGGGAGDGVALPPMHTGPPFPDLFDNQTLLISLSHPPPALHVPSLIAKYLAPTPTLLALVRDSVVSGRQAQLVDRLAGSVRQGDPWTLAGNVATRMWKLLWKDEEGGQGKEGV
ncbi:hypothetical protein HETIRDRAFT_423532 [Heterobasidion irregulare TC 32-1]|uniref:Uncharacterized protein n=1 Tax=Heterobasidion irregulare (strain TC 32-1) TaxID=747525 RepID=W4JN15_HETIT|nr:uncharacterized protein HETIRDRAFT_423532 [Heterobasidion irregulare TC 32-1]ETW74928.1 hypothetical protein HETIRDRAFT_423532 [Heterobasidion irregulare TC 32-1]